MQNRFTRTTHDCARQLQNHSATLGLLARDTLNGFFTTAHHTLMISGIAALCTLAVMFYRPDLAQQLKTLSPFRTIAAQGSTTNNTVNPASGALFGYEQGATTDQTGVTGNPPPGAVGKRSIATGTERQQQWVTSWLSKRYRVANDATHMLVNAAYTTAGEIKIDPLLILAVVAIESGFNPFAESAVGAQGLMQVMSKIHHEKFQELGGIKAALNPVANIRVGSLILKDYVARGGSLEAGLKMYVGAAAFDNDAGYGSKVLAEYRRLRDVATGKSVPVFAVSTPAPVAARNTPKPAENENSAPKATTASEDSKAVRMDGLRNPAHADQIAAM